jgi:hypothetical protein
MLQAVPEDGERKYYSQQFSDQSVRAGRKIKLTRSGVVLGCVCNVEIMPRSKRLLISQCRVHRCSKLPTRAWCFSALNMLDTAERRIVYKENDATVTSRKDDLFGHSVKAALQTSSETHPPKTGPCMPPLTKKSD